MQVLFSKFKQNHFNPAIHPITNIPNGSGNYIVCLRRNSKLPIATIGLTPTLTMFEGCEVIYTGISSKSLRDRDYKQHFNGHAGRSTLRKSLGVLFGYKQIPRDPNSGKTKFNEKDEQALSAWMHGNLIMYLMPNEDYNKYELQLIDYFKPPLNLKNNHNPINSEFRNKLKMLRRDK